MYTLKLPLETTAHDRAVLEKRFVLHARLRNILVKHAKPLIRRVQSNKWYHRKLMAYARAKARISVLEKYLSDEDTDKRVIPPLKKEKAELTEQAKELSAEMSGYRKRIGLTKEALEAYCKKFQKQYAFHVSSHTAQKVADNVWSGVEKVLFGDGDGIRFRRWGDFRTIPSKSAWNGIRFYCRKIGADYTPKSYNPVHDTGIEFLGLDIRVKMDWDDPYKAKSILGACLLRYCTIVREAFESGYRYYVILTMDGAAPKKIAPHEVGKSVAGADPGTSTFAYSSDTTAAFEELAPKAKEYNKKIISLQRKIDRSMRVHNPDNYNADGTVKKGKRKWVTTRRCKKLKWKLKVLYRKKSEYISCEHNNRANRVVRDASVFFTEKMDFSALSKRSSKEAERSDKVSAIKQKDGTVKEVRKFKKKRRFGKSVNDRAPAAQLRAIQAKLERYGGEYHEVDTKAFRASQYDHAKDAYIKVPLSQREKDVGGHKVQRDMYSAFLLQHSIPSLDQSDREACTRDFKAFLEMQDACIAYLKKNDFSMPSCAGF